jgi:hypothetical protein
MQKSLLTLLRECHKEYFSGTCEFFASDSNETIGKLFFLQGTPLHFLSEYYGSGFGGLLELYKKQQASEDLWLATDSTLILVDGPNINYSYERLIINLFDSYREYKFEQKYLVSSPEFFLEY